MTGRIVVERVSNLGQLTPLAEEWDTLLLQNPLPSVFLTYDWVSTWWKHFGGADELFVLVAKEKGSLVGVAPLSRRKTRWGYRLECIGVRNFLSDRVGFVVHPEKSREVIAAFCSHLLEEKNRWQVLDLKNIPESSPDSIALRDVLTNQSQLLWEAFAFETCPYVPLRGSWEDYLSTKKRHRRNLNQAQNRLKRRGEPSFEQHADPGEIEEFLPLFMEISEQSVQYARGMNILIGPGRKAFLEEMIPLLSRKGRVVLSILRLDSRPIGCDLGLLFGGKLSGYSLAYVSGFPAISLGTFILGRVLEHAFARSIQEFDFSTGGQDFKLGWTTLSRRHLRILIVHRGLAGRLRYLLPMRGYQYLKEQEWLRNIKARLDRRLLSSFGGRLKGRKGKEDQ